MFKKLLIICLFFGVLLFGSVDVNVDKGKVVRGEEVTFTISASGDNVKFPTISSIGGYKVEQTGRSQNITIINGKTTKTISSSYAFTPLSSVKVPSFEVEVDGKKEMTKPFDIKVVKASQAGVNPNFLLQMVTDKKSVFVGEPITLKIIFKQKRDANVDGIQFNSPSFPGFWVKSDGKDRKTIVGDYVIHNITYVLIPQNSGKLKIPPVKVSIAKRVQVRDAFSFMLQRIKWKNIFSNEINIDVKPLPAGVEVFGKFSINATVDKKVTKANKPVNLTLKIKGSGNIDDIDSFNLQIKNATVYKDQPKRDTYLENGEYKGVFTQKFAIVSDSDFTIPGIKFSYFDRDEKRVVTIKTKPIKIKVEGGAPSISHSLVTSNTPEKTKIAKKVVYKKEKTYIKWIFLLAGLIIGFLVSNIKNIKLFKKESSERDAVYEIKHAKSDKELLKILLSFSKKSPYIDKTLNLLEENIYLGKKNKIDKKTLIKEVGEVLHPKEEEEI